MNEEQGFLAEAQRVRDEQVASQGVTSNVDPAVQAGIDHAIETAGSGPKPGSRAPGLRGLGGLSKSDIDAQKKDIAQRDSAEGR